MRVSITQTWKHLVLAGALIVAALAGCDEEGAGPDPDGGSGPITATRIIVNPKSPAPGDTIQLTVVLESDTVNIGDFPSVTWTTSGGVLLENGQTSVRWVAPAVSALFDIDVTATNSVNTTGVGTTVFVGESTTLIASGAGQVFLRPNGVDFVYLRTPNLSGGLELYEYTGGIVNDLVPGQLLGKNVAVAPTLTGSAYETESPPAGNFIEPVNLNYADLIAGTEMQITADHAVAGSRRRDQYTNGSFSPSGVLLAYQGLRPAPLASEIDSIDVFVYNTDTQTTSIVTRTHGLVRRNFFPSFSPDGNWLVFVSDRNGQNKWEYYALAVTGGTQVATDSASTVRLTNTNGTVTSGTYLTMAEPFRAWSPVDPVLAFVGSTGVLYQLTVNAQGGTLTPVTGYGSGAVREIVWSADGTTLAFTNGSMIFTVPLTGATATVRHMATADDLVRDLTWSPDLRYMVFRVTRGTTTWFELLDISAGTLDQTVVLTPSSEAGEVGAYRNVMSTAAIYTPADELITLIFDSPTPSVQILDVSGAIQ